MRLASSVAVLMFLATARTAAAQSSDFAAYTALIHTPIGLFIPVVPRSQLGLPSDGAAFGVQYGRHAAGDVNNKAQAYAVTIYGGGERSTLSFTGGAYKETCPDPECKNVLMAGVGAQTRLVETTLSGKERFGVDLAGNVGYGAKQFSTTYIAAQIGLPVTLSNEAAKGGGMQIALWAAPGFAYGDARLNATSIEGTPFSDKRSGTCPTAAAGIAFYNPPENISLQLGLTKAFADQSKPVLGVNLILHW